MQHEAANLTTNAHHGTLVRLSFNDSNVRYEALVSSVGANLLELKVNGRDLLPTFDLQAPAPRYQGAVIAPWPNRIKDGKYSFEGQEFQLPINEVERNNALHGLISMQDFTLNSADDSMASFSYFLPASTYYPFPLLLQVEYVLTADGITTTLEAKNIGSSPAPYGACPHPYMIAGSATPSEWILDFAPSHVLEVDEQLIPTQKLELDPANPWTPRPGKVLGSIQYDHAFTGFKVGKVKITDPSGSFALMEFDPQIMPWLQIYTPGDSVAIEPMTCPANAFNSGAGLIKLAPGSTHKSWWRISGG